MQFDVITLFPELFESFRTTSLIGKACENGLITIRLHNLRDWTKDKHRSVDDRPYGGGPGMVMKPEPVVEAVEQIVSENPDTPTRIIMLTPQGKPLDQKKCQDLADSPDGLRLVLICGRYEGFDARIRTILKCEEVSIGDYVLAGGEIPAMTVIEATARLIPGVLGHDESTVEESFSEGWLEYPQYTRPAIYRGLEVPEVLLSGNHMEVRRWREDRSRERTQKQRPDMVQKGGRS